MISRIPQVRRVLNALKGLAALRHGEAAGLRWSDYQTASEPLGRLVISRSYEKERTKTQITRLVPVHPVLAQVLADWKGIGWSQTFDRDPEPSDLIVPNHHLEVWPAHDADDTFKDDLAAVGLRNRRGHDLRRTFITLVQVDGGRRDLLKVITHGPAADDIINLYTTFPWPSLCAEVAKLAVTLPTATPAPDETPQPTEAPAILVVDATENEREPETNNVVPLFGPCSATCSATSDPRILNLFEPLARFERATYGLRRRDHSGIQELPRESSTHEVDDDVDPHASTRIDQQALVDRVSLHLIDAHARWITGRDRAELRRVLLQLLVAIDG